ncbi:hypothetical protein D9M68_966820 [compost metagenome]
MFFFRPALRIEILEHQELAKGEEAQRDLIASHFPAPLLADHISNIAIEAPQAALIGRKAVLVESARSHIQAEIGLELGNQRKVRH